MGVVVREAGAATDVGRLRQSNEDALILSAPVYAVADGMGGARAGEVASAMAVAALHGVGGNADALRRAVEDVNARIHGAAGSDPSLQGMGTTLSAALVDGAEVVIAHVGDSRAYLLRAGRLRQLTDDHSLVGELIRRGALTPAEAERHPQRSVITRALGAEGAVEVDVVRLDPQPGDLLLLCSDGLTGMIGDGEIERILGDGGSLDERAARLIAAANGAGGEDNISVVVLALDVVGDEDTAPGTPPVRVEPATALRLAPDLGVALAGTAPVASRGRFALVLAGIAALGIVIAVGVAVLLQWAHFVGATDDGRIAVYQGLPFAITDDATLYRPVVISAVPAAALDDAELDALLDHRIGSRSGAEERVAALEASSPWLISPPAAR